MSMQPQQQLQPHQQPQPWQQGPELVHQGTHAASGAQYQAGVFGAPVSQVGAMPATVAAVASNICSGQAPASKCRVTVYSDSGVEVLGHGGHA